MAGRSTWSCTVKTRPNLARRHEVVRLSDHHAMDLRHGAYENGGAPGERPTKRRMKCPMPPAETPVTARRSSR